MFKLLILILLSFFLGTTLSATKLSSKNVRQGLSSSQFSSTLSTMNADTSDHDELWYWLNLARLQQVDGNYTASIDSFEKGFAILDEYENRATISMRNVGSFVGSSLLSKGAETYYGKGYERTLMHTINALNYTMLGRFEGAAVEMRRMEQRQEFWLKETEGKIKEAAEAKAEAQKKGATLEDMPNGYSMASMLQNEEVRTLANSYQDPFSYTLSSIINTIITKAKVDTDVNYKRAITLNPDVAKVFISDHMPPKTVDVVVVVLAGIAPSLKIDKIKFPIFQGASYTSIDLPAFTPPLGDISSLTVSSPSFDSKPPRLLKTNIMAYKTLKDELPSDIAKAVVRATTKGVTAKQANDHFGGFAGLLTSLVMDIGSSFADASYRNWETLPNSGYLLKFKANQGETITMTLDNYSKSITLPSDSTGVLILGSYLTSDNIRIDHVKY